MILVTGGTGYLGSNLIQDMIRKDPKKEKKILILDRDRTKARKMFPGVKFRKGDITDLHSILPAFRGVKQVVHLAGLVSYRPSDRDRLFSVNVSGTRNVVEACLRSNVKHIVFSSSVSVYGESDRPVTEHEEPDPPNFYGETKLEAEKLIVGSGLKYSILRIAPLYGRGSPAWDRNLRIMEKGFPIPSTGKSTHVCHVSEAVQAIELALKKGQGIFNIASKSPVKFTDFAGRIMKIMGRPAGTAPFWWSSLLARLGGMKPYFDVLVRNRRYSTSKARDSLGFRPEADLEDCLRDMVMWWKMKKTLS